MSVDVGFRPTDRVRFELPHDFPQKTSPQHEKNSEHGPRTPRHTHPLTHLSPRRRATHRLRRVGSRVGRAALLGPYLVKGRARARPQLPVQLSVACVRLSRSRTRIPTWHHAQHPLLVADWWRTKPPPLAIWYPLPLRPPPPARARSTRPTTTRTIVHSHPPTFAQATHERAYVLTHTKNISSDTSAFGESRGSHFFSPATFWSDTGFKASRR
jgi:hypothetical protein